MEDRVVREAVYPVEAWRVTEEAWREELNYRNETTFALSNGYLGTRGTFEEGYEFGTDVGLEGNFINGFYESEEIRYGEWNYGFPTRSQSLLNLPNGKIIQVSVDGEALDIRSGKIRDYTRYLDMQAGIVVRKLVWTTLTGKEVQIETQRLVSLKRKNLMAIQYQIKPLNFSGKIEVVSGLDAVVENHTRKTNPLVDYGPFGRCLLEDVRKAEPVLYYEGHTRNSGLSMACGCQECFEGEVVENLERKGRKEEGEPRIWAEYSLDGREQQSITFTKYIAYTSSLDMPKEEMEAFVYRVLAEAEDTGYHQLRVWQRAEMDAYWGNADIAVEGEAALIQGLHFNLFHIMQAAGRDGRTGMGAKGLSGEGYEGHYFWDTEMYVLPVFVYTCPDVAKSLLAYRFHTLSEARERARVLGHEKGALYPWRTINGQEASTYYPLGTAQYHINADVAYAFWLYIEVTQDMEFLKEMAAEVLCETARIWADVGCFVESKGNRYCICSVTGPDEYNAIVDNNFYTNLMARENLKYALRALDLLKEYDQEACRDLTAKLGLQEAEVVLWASIIERMYFPYDETLQVYPQDDGFMMRKPWDDSKIPAEKRHLLYENYHPLFIFRQRMSKQADAILGFQLCAEQFEKEVLKRNYDFYQTVTLHHSSLSTCIFGMLACEIGYEEEAYSYFAQSARMDLDDYHENFYAGIHAANMGGTWMAIANGFGGVRIQEDTLSLRPVLPKKWKQYSFHLQYRGSRLAVCRFGNGTRVTLMNDVPATFRLYGKLICLHKGEEIYEEI